MASKEYLATLNPEQRRAVEHGVIAVAPISQVRFSSSPEPDRERPIPSRIA